MLSVHAQNNDHILHAIYILLLIILGLEKGLITTGLVFSEW